MDKIEITNNIDVKMEMLVNGLKEKEAEGNRIIDTCRKMIEMYQDKINLENEKIENTKIYVKQQIENMLEMVEMKQTKTQYTYKIPSAKLIKKKVTKSIEKTNDLIYWIKENRANEYLRTEIKESVDWKEFKKKLTISENVVVDENGEVVAGVNIVEKEGSFDIKFE